MNYNYNQLHHAWNECFVPGMPDFTDFLAAIVDSPERRAADLAALIRSQESEVMKALADRIAGNAHPGEEDRLEVAYAIARYLKLDWPAVSQSIALSEAFPELGAAVEGIMGLTIRKEIE